MISNMDPSASSVQTGEWPRDVLTAYAPPIRIGDTPRSRGASAADICRGSAARDYPPRGHSRRRPSTQLSALSRRLGHVGCPASRSMRPRICRKSAGVKRLSASWRMKWRACRMRHPEVLNSRRWRLVSDQLEMAKGRTNRAVLPSLDPLLRRPASVVDTRTTVRPSQGGGDGPAAEIAECVGCADP